jgi:hypothetical protein
MADNTAAVDKVALLVSTAGPVRAGIVGGDIVAISGPYYGPLQTGVWAVCPPLFKLRLTGSGTCVMDARSAAGTITTGVESYTATGSTTQIEFPYPGDDAKEIRVTLTGTCAAEVM